MGRDGSGAGVERLRLKSKRLKEKRPPGFPALDGVSYAMGGREAGEGTKRLFIYFLFSAILFWISKCL